ncbi:cobalt-precorrin 5A hydrolase [Desulfovibrio litoralis]|uniref:Cobalt-precorrin 5A hydrolase n=1 Tax=Desulfovibrio litoralis DSM 11393 TaxID=1121455 RepID=A0A1M7SAX4_9BACT|nr:cobalamin biosynthesis protein [Desulfovibrio litoralis]SHN55660.1 cobalt-precorrin 5A hydrolase [Desulfovibrio litoralis DSM 11393]
MQAKTKIAIYAFTQKGASLAQTVASCLKLPLDSEKIAGDEYKRLSRLLDQPSIELYFSQSCEADNENKEASVSVFSVNCFSSLSKLMHTESHFSRFSAHIIIGATGIAVRAIAPFIQDKTQDPAVIVIDQQANFVISLLSGHLGMANSLSSYLATALNIKGFKTQAVITTATDLENVPAIDSFAQDRELFIDNPDQIKTISSALLHKQKVYCLDETQSFLPAWEEKFGTAYLTRLNLSELSECKSPLIYLGHETFKNMKQVLYLRPKTLILGLGCKRGVSFEALSEALSVFLTQCKVSQASLAGLATIQEKHTEAGILTLAEYFNIPVYFFSANELAQIKTPNHSPKALEQFGTPSVAEAAALLGASLLHDKNNQQLGLTDNNSLNLKAYHVDFVKLRHEKHKFINITFALAEFALRTC